MGERVSECVCVPWLDVQRTVKRLHLSKVKTSKYYDSGCLVVFYLVSVVWGVDIILSSGYATNPTLLWHKYPHTLMRWVHGGQCNSYVMVFSAPPPASPSSSSC